MKKIKVLLFVILTVTLTSCGYHTCPTYAFDNANESKTEIYQDKSI